jgi:hypothetical protein
MAPYDEDTPSKMAPSEKNSEGACEAEEAAVVEAAEDAEAMEAEAMKAEAMEAEAMEAEAETAAASEAAAARYPKRTPVPIAEKMTSPGPPPGLGSKQPVPEFVRYVVVSKYYARVLDGKGRGARADVAVELCLPQTTVRRVVEVYLQTGSNSEQERSDGVVLIGSPEVA